MIIVINPKKTLVITSLGLCLVGSLFAALKFYYRSFNKDKKVNKNRTSASVKSTSSIELLKTKKQDRKTVKITNEKNVYNDENIENKTLAAEELLELGLNFLNQAIKSWETALDHIESAEYMQSGTLALPNDEHADLVYKLRNLVESANNITLNCGPKLIKSTLLKNSHSTRNLNEDLNNENTDQLNSPIGSVSKRYGYLSDDDNESFVSADSDVDWLTAEMLANIEHTDETNVLYEMAMSSVVLGRVKYRVSRKELLNCKSEEDFAAKLHVIRLGFDRLFQNNSKKQWFIDEGKTLLSCFFKKSEKDCTKLFKAYDEMIRFVSVETNWKNIKDELATREVNFMNFYDIALDFILLDAFEDLEDPPSAISSVIQNRWLSQSFKETALSTAVWSVLKAKRKLLKYPDGFITRFYSINEYLVPVLAWGFLGTDEELKNSCTYLKNTIVDYLKCLFDLNRTRYTNLEDLAYDIEMHSVNYLKDITENI
ncbi:unnamed protein product [Brachionus calyciflorus]|uniref:Uncharacterized protein n=1 Tax=Brachionus calyciflorus TaxID=104777 RepID=A0A813YB74_9BILA|nr:unnamed protein product [Brachionus calyciflorus]